MSTTSNARQLYERQSPHFNSNTDAVAYAVHVAFIVDGFTLVGLDDDLTARDRAFDGLPGQWNASQEVYTFRYRDSDVHVVVKAMVMGTTLFVHATRHGATDVYSVELRVDDHIVADADLNQPDNIYNDLDGLVGIVNQRVVSNIRPPRQAGGGGGPPRPFHDDSEDNNPLRIGQRQPAHPVGDFDDDLVPSFDPFHPLGRGGGNIMGPHHPMFGRGRGQPQRGGRNGPRFDPFGPDGGFSGDPNRDLFPPPGTGGPPHFPF